MKQTIVFLFLVLLTLMLVRAEAMDHYADAPQVKKMLNILEKNASKCLTTRNLKHCKRGRKPVTKGTGWCYRYVKLGLVRAGLTSLYIGGGSAKEAGPYLKKEGFVDILQGRNSTPLNPPNGAIFVFDRRKHGHIEVKADTNKFISDHINESTNGRLLGIYLKKEILEINKAKAHLTKEEQYEWIFNNIQRQRKGKKQRLKRSSFNYYQCEEIET